jgi:hypothetical protein
MPKTPKAKIPKIIQPMLIPDPNYHNHVARVVSKYVIMYRNL